MEADATLKGQVAMTPRLNIHTASPEAAKAMLAVENATHDLTIGPALRMLIKMRVSQINGCAYCLDMHAPEALKAGVTQQQLDVLAAWRESPAFDARERAALGWADTLTRIEATGAPDADYAALAEAFYVTVAPHNPMGPLATAVNLHFSAACANFKILEYRLPHGAAYTGHGLSDSADGAGYVKDPYLPVDGHLDLRPDRPGWGVEIDEEYLKTDRYVHWERKLPMRPDGSTGYC